MAEMKEKAVRDKGKTRIHENKGMVVKAVGKKMMVDDGRGTVDQNV